MMILALLLACDDGSDKGTETGETGDSGADGLSFTIPFRGRAGGVDFTCSQDLSGLGTAASTVTPRDFRLYVHSVQLLDASGAGTPLTLEQDGVWQYEDVALLDFEDASGDCTTGSPDMNTEIVGTAPAGEYVGLAFSVGVPDELNHIDAATAPPPLNDTGLWWSWTGGYKFAKIDVTTPESTGFVFHLGATDCEKLDDGTYSCTLANAAEISLDGFDPESSAVSLDLADLYAQSDLSGAMPEGDSMPGCMSSGGDPECTGLFDAIGLPWEDNTSPGEQTLFKVEAR